MDATSAAVHQVDSLTACQRPNQHPDRDPHQRQEATPSEQCERSGEGWDCVVSAGEHNHGQPRQQEDDAVIAECIFRCRPEQPHGASQNCQQRRQDDGKRRGADVIDGCD